MDTIRRLEWKSVFDTIHGYMFRYHKAGDDRVRPSTGSDNADLHAENSRAVIDTIYGNTVKWNQLVQNGNFSDGATGWTAYGSATVSVQDGILSVTTNAVTDGTITAIHVPSNHKAYIAYDIKGNSTNSCMLYTGGNNIKFDIPITTTWCRISHIASPNWATNLIWRFNNNEYTAQLKNIILIDITLLGIDNLTTVAEVEAWLAKNVGMQDYYPYDTGSLISFGGTAIKSTGFNQFNKELWTLTNNFLRSNGTTGSSANYDISDYIRVLPSTIYYFKDIVASNAGSPSICWYDINKTYISGVDGGSNINNQTIQSPSNAAYLKLSIYRATKDNACVNLSDPVKNGTYEPYWEDVVDLSFVPNIGFETFNIWDEEWETGYWNENGVKGTSDNQIRSKQMFKIIGGASYYVNRGAVYRALWYNSNKELISHTDGIGSLGTFTAPVNAEYLNFSTAVGYGGTYNHDICINESVAGLNGMYLPYGTPYYLFPDGKLKSAGSVSDEVSATTATKRIKVVDLGNLGWLRSGTYNSFYVSLDDAKNNTIGSNIICTKYDTRILSKMSNDSVDKEVYGWDSQRRIYIRDDSYSDTTVFTSAMRGVKLYYELATPITITHNDTMTYKVDKYSTEELLVPTSQTGGPTSTALNADIDYQYRG